MKEKIHPKYEKVKVICACGNEFETRSTIGGSEIRTEICSGCHPFFTGKQKLMDSAGRVEKFNRKFGRSTGADGKIISTKPTIVKAKTTTEKVETKAETKVETKPKAESKPKVETKSEVKTHAASTTEKHAEKPATEKHTEKHAEKSGAEKTTAKKKQAS